MKARLLILGVLHRGDFHPYEIKRRLENAMVECYIDVDVGTLYYATRQLEKEGLISAVSQERVARGGMRTVYSVTEQGRLEFRRLLHGQFEQDGPVSQTLYGALLFLHLCDLAIVEALVRKKIAGLDKQIAKLGPVREKLSEVLSTGGDYLLRHLDRQRRLDRDWLKELLADIEARRVRDVARPDKLGSNAG
ncbi:MAG TPA: PadR family transcriptional regulator [Rhizomicrobium sp.]|jgi:DNA-binding PadR family transcriptional regulator|nr:PadR family transcriptional regulator [Rhizomicrobium sp.]